VFLNLQGKCQTDSDVNRNASGSLSRQQNR
jgi:hypothetical protein